MKQTPRFAALALATLLAGCAAGTTGPDRAGLKTESQCVTSSNASACKLQHDKAGGYPFALGRGGD